ncbi:MAG: hypothetical protein JNL10_03795 [Verrucomicrobiales bacterium]|nr:hypothetical protein [Verrucomicrobiales bacterium]
MLPPGIPDIREGFFSSSEGLAGSLSSSGWSTTGWSIGLGSKGGRFQAGGSTREGFSGAVGGGVWVYGWGRSEFSATLELQQPFRYVALTPTLRASGLTGPLGFLPAATYGIQGQAYGRDQAYSVDARFEVPTASEAQVLQGVALALSAPVRVRDKNGILRWVIAFEFRPNATSVGEAAEVLGGYSINFVSTIIAAPSAWEWIDNGVVVKPAGAPMPEGGIVDGLPPPSANGRSRAIVDRRVQEAPFPVTYDGDLNSTTSPLYFNDSAVNAWRTSAAITWSDSPRVHAGSFQSGDPPLTFRTQAVVVDQNGVIKAYLGAPLEWYSDQTTTGGSIRIATGPVVSAGIEEGEVFEGGIYLGLPQARILAVIPDLVAKRVRVIADHIYPEFTYSMEYTNDLGSDVWTRVTRAQNAQGSGRWELSADVPEIGARYYRVQVTHP